MNGTPVLDYPHPATAGDPTWAPDPSQRDLCCWELIQQLKAPRLITWFARAAGPN